jgi:hypothetical protein
LGPHVSMLLCPACCLHESQALFSLLYIRKNVD